MDFKDYYGILGLKENADGAEIKKAYRKLARKYHPDVSSEANAESSFKEVTEAYEVLKDPEKRAEYDQLRKLGAMGSDGSFQPPPQWESATHFSDEGFGGGAGFSDFFESIFGRHGTAHRSYRSGRQQQFRMRGEDIHAQLSLLLEEAFHGGPKTVAFAVPEVDDYGLITHRRRKLKVKIPPNVSPETPIRLRGQGAPGVGGGEPGDLFIEVQIAPHPVFTLKGKNLYRTLHITPWEAALGASIEVATLADKVKLTIPSNSRSGTRLRVKGKGFAGGDLYIELRIVIPETHSEKARALYRQLAEECAFNPRAEEERAKS